MRLRSTSSKLMPSAGSLKPAASAAAGRDLLPDFERQVFDRDVVGLREQDGALDGRLQLAHVAGPRVFEHHLARVGRESAYEARGVARVLLQEEVDQDGDVVAALAQRRHVDGEDVDAVVEVVAEAAVRDHRAQVAVGRGDDAHVNLDGARAADATNLALLQARAEASPASRCRARRSRRERACRGRRSRRDPSSRRARR